MATTGKLPMLGFKAAAIKFATLFGYSPNDSVAATAAILITARGRTDYTLVARGQTTARLEARGQTAGIITARGEGGTP